MVDPLLAEIEHCLGQADARGELLVAVHLATAIEALREGHDPGAPAAEPAGAEVIDLATHRRRRSLN